MKKKNLVKPGDVKTGKALELYRRENNGIDSCCPQGQSGNCKC